MSNVTVDTDEFGVPVTDRYKRLGAKNEECGLYVRFEPGFGLNVHIGKRCHDFRFRDSNFDDVELMCIGVDGWERLGELVDQWREREAMYEDEEAYLKWVNDPQTTAKIQEAINELKASSEGSTGTTE